MPHPGILCKCAEAIEKKGIARILKHAVCDKCAKAYGNKGIKGRRGSKELENTAEGVPHPRVFCMSIKTKKMQEEGFA